MSGWLRLTGMVAGAVAAFGFGAAAQAGTCTIGPAVDFAASTAIIDCTVAAAGTYTITAIGASGGGGNPAPGGPGAKVSGDFVLSQNEVLQILVGAGGGSSNGAIGGGGGGSFVVVDDAGILTPLIIAGGGGGGGIVGAGDGGLAGTSGGGGNGGSNGGGGGAISGGSGGGGGGYSGGGGGVSGGSGGGGGSYIASSATNPSATSGGGSAYTLAGSPGSDGAIDFVLIPTTPPGSVPEPASFGLLATGAIGFGAARRVRRRIPATEA